MCLPTWTSETFVHPSAGSADITALPAGSDRPGFSDTSTSNVNVIVVSSPTPALIR